MSKVTIVKCDCCGCEIASDYTYKIYPQIADLQGEFETTQPFEGEMQLDYCKDCAQAVLDFLHGQPKEVPPPSEKTRKEESSGRRKGACPEESRLDKCEDRGRNGSQLCCNLPMFEEVYRIASSGASCLIREV